VTGCYENAKKILLDNKDTLNRLASELLEKEVLNTAELDAIIGIPTAGVEKEGEQGNPADGEA